jgi:hypothetical protein
VEDTKRGEKNKSGMRRRNRLGEIQRCPYEEQGVDTWRFGRNVRRFGMKDTGRSMENIKMCESDTGKFEEG